MKRIKLITKIGGKALPRLGGTGKIPGGIPHLRHHRDDGRSTDRSEKPAKTVIGPIIRGMILNINLMQNYSENSVTANNSLLSPTGSVKSISPNTENWLRKLYDKNYNNDKSTEDKHKTNYSMNNDTRNMHIT